MIARPPLDRPPACIRVTESHLSEAMVGSPLFLEELLEETKQMKVAAAQTSEVLGRAASAGAKTTDSSAGPACFLWGHIAWINCRDDSVLVLCLDLRPIISRRLWARAGISLPDGRQPLEAGSAPPVTDLCPGSATSEAAPSCWSTAGSKGDIAAKQRRGRSAVQQARERAHHHHCELAWDLIANQPFMCSLLVPGRDQRSSRKVPHAPGVLHSELTVSGLCSILELCELRAAVQLDK